MKLKLSFNKEKQTYFTIFFTILGIPVSPNSDYERAAILSTFPGQTLRVAGCRDVLAIDNVRFKYFFMTIVKT